MEIVTGALGAVLSKLGELLKDEYNLNRNVRKDIENLSSELESMKGTLSVIGGVPPEELSEPQRIWARDLRELSYDMEDIVDTFLVDVRRSDPHAKSINKGFINIIREMVNKARSSRGIGHEIKAIMERVKEVAERRDRYKVDTTAPVKTSIDPRITSLYTDLKDLVGIDEARKEVVAMLTREDGISTQQQRIISIVGFGGLGKTTLAKAVCDELKTQFDCTAFVPVSQTPDTNKVLKDILYGLDKKKYENIHSTMLDARHLIDKVREFLQDKRYLIVIDDIWSEEPWKIIRCALVENNRGSRIVTTTRIIDVAEQVGGCCYNLKPLDPRSSRILFCRRIFGHDDKLAEEFSEVSEKILNKCGGVPLAIKATSSLLVHKKENVNEWNKFCESIGSGRSNNGVENMRKILSLSYYDLPSHLKTCLLYLSIFPEDYDIARERLIWRWIAEGFVEHDDVGQSLFDIGESYFNCLVNRSLIEPIYDGVVEAKAYAYRPVSCLVHDMVHDLIRSLAREENFVATGLDESNQNTASSSRKIRRLSFHHTAWPPRIVSKWNITKLRSLAAFGPAAMEIKDCHNVNDCHHLRVMDLEDCHNLRSHQDVKFIRNLTHLRYLGLPSRVYTDELLAEIGNLKFLQRLDLSGARAAIDPGEMDIGELPLSILGLTQLMFLSGTGFTRLPAGLRNLTSLQELRGVSVDCAQVAEELGHLTQLRVLEVMLGNFNEVSDESLDTALVGSLGKMHNIQSLEVSECYGRPVDLDAAEGSMDSSVGNLHNLIITGASLLPTWIKPESLPLLSTVKIGVSQLRADDITVLGKLQALRFLQLIVIGDTRTRRQLEKIAVGVDAFPRLVHCKLFWVAVVPSMFPQGAMPMLEDFLFYMYLDAFTTGGELTVDDLALGHLPSLKTVDVTLVTKKEGDSKGAVARTVKEKLMHEGAIHPNHPSISFSTRSGSIDQPGTSMQMDGEQWVLDCRAPMHYTTNVRLLDGCDALLPSLRHDNDNLHVLGRGSVRTERFEVQDVSYVDGDARNVISVAQLVRSHGLVTVFEPTAGYVREPATGKELGRACLRDGAYVLEYLRIGGTQSIDPRDVVDASLSPGTAIEELHGGISELKLEAPDTESWFGMSRPDSANDLITIPHQDVIFPMSSPHDEQQRGTRTKEFYMDSSACHHMTWNADVLKAYHDDLQIKAPIQSSVIGAEHIQAAEIGYIDSKGGSLDCVLFVPDSTVNLVSVSQLTEDCFVRVVFHLDEFWIEKLESKEIIGHGKRVGLKYVVAVLDDGAASDWILDSNTFIHHTPNRKMLSHCQDTAQDQASPGAAQPQILGRGSVRTERFKIPDIRYTKGEDARNVISVAQLADDHGFVTVFLPKLCYVKHQDTGQTVGKGRLLNGTYVLDYLRIDPNKGRGEQTRDIEDITGHGGNVGHEEKDEEQTGAGDGGRGGSGHGQESGGSESGEGEKGSTEVGAEGVGGKEGNRDKDEDEEGGKGDSGGEKMDDCNDGNGREDEDGDVFGLSRFDRIELGEKDCCRPYHLDEKGCTLAAPAMPSPNNQRPTHFLMDSGACFHMTWDSSAIHRYPEHLRIQLPTRSISGVSGSEIAVDYCGYIQSDTTALDGVLFVPQLAMNLVSVSQLADQYDVGVTIQKQGFSVNKVQNGETIGRGHRLGQHYILDFFLPGYFIHCPRPQQ